MKKITATHSVTEALAGIPDEEQAEIVLEPRVYEEKIFSEKQDLTLTGAGAGKSILLWRDAAFTMQDDGFKRGTFRSYTAFFGGKRLVLRDLTIRNDAGDGRLAGQSVAAYLDSTHVFAENCDFISCQDTLFLSPLPDEVREPRGFMGPREDTPRLLTRQYFKNCRIIGDVDFIFGGADAVFENCEIICRDREHVPGMESEAGAEDFINGYLTAPCGKRGGLGLVFLNCTISAQVGTRPGTVYLGRPWRPEGKAAFLECTYTDAIAPLRFSGWGSIDKDEPDAGLCEYKPMTEDHRPLDISGRNPWVRLLDDSEADEIKQRAAALKSEITV